MELSENKKREGRHCCAYACRNKPVARKGGLCHKHYARRLKERDPVYARYNQFKSSATQRGKPFFVTLAQFKWFCIKNNYLNKGQRGQNATIDRRCNLHGYYIWNMQILSLAHNASKGAGPSADCPF